MITTHYKAKSLVPLCISFALFAFVLTPALFSISSSLSLRSIGTPLQSTLGQVAHLIALVFIGIVPCILAIIAKNYWRWTALYAVASTLMLLRFAPEAHFTQIIRLPIGMVSFLIVFALMITSATFGVFIRSSYIQRKWIAFWVQVITFIIVTFGAYVYLAIPLFVE